MAKRRQNSKPTKGKFAPGNHELGLTELFALVRNVNPTWMATETEPNTWNGGLTMADALDAAEFGRWDAPAIESITLPEIAGESIDTQYRYDVTGMALDVATFLSGEPEYWRDEITVPKPCGRVIRLSIEIGGMNEVSAASMANRGQAIIALINSLELQGHSVELTIVRAYVNTSSERYSFLIPVKHAGQALDMKRIQFMIGHPSFYRRVLFGLAEVAHNASLGTVSTGTREYCPEGFTAHIPSYAGLSSTLDGSLNWAKQFALTLAN
jgi:hypothetical protein